MAVTTADLREFVGATTNDDSLLSGCLLEATELVDKYVGDNEVPDAILDRAYVEVAADLFHRRNAPNGIANQQFALPDGGFGGQAIRIARDPLTAAYKILGRWVSPW